MRHASQKEIDEQEKAIEERFHDVCGRIMQGAQEQVDRRMLHVYYALLVDLTDLNLNLLLLTRNDHKCQRMT